MYHLTYSLTSKFDLITLIIIDFYVLLDTLDGLYENSLSVIYSLCRASVTNLIFFSTKVDDQILTSS